MFQIPPEPRFSVNWDEAEKLASLARGKRVLEIGAFRGHSTLALATTADSIVSVDCFTGGEAVVACDGDSLPDFLKATEALRERGQLITIVGKTADVLPMLKLSKFDLIFHDAAHDYMSVHNDLSIIIAGARSVGSQILAVHDYGTEEGTKEACDALGLVCVEKTSRLAVFRLDGASQAQFRHMDDSARVPQRTNADWLLRA